MLDSPAARPSVAGAGDTSADSLMGRLHFLSVETEVMDIENGNRALRYAKLDAEDTTRDDGAGCNASAWEGAAADHGADTTGLLAPP